MGHYHNAAAALREPTRDLCKAILYTWAGFAAKHPARPAEVAIPTPIKELVALVVES